ncbi:unnamed protein product [Caenorhabditis auriculariae]|uniref:EamA domain-containing protein n=1 Tax=Caenorhabditis auriculariae TaxID=2777116 RepID=A0A8S1HEN6_9PELO|nr:unnamed protein product [Caenorhabditis auriculariae]
MSRPDVSTPLIAMQNLTERAVEMNGGEKLREVETDQKTPSYMIGLKVLFIGSVALSWSLATQFSKTALTINAKEFDAPYFMMWFNTNFMIACFPIAVIIERVRTKKSLSEIYDESQRIFRSRGLSVISLLYYVLPFLVLWAGANYTYAQALTSVNASVATSITACNTAIIYVLSIFILSEKFSIHKLIAVIFAIGGVCMISTESMSSGHWQGYVLSIASACFSASYKVFFMKSMRDFGLLGQISLFMTCLGFLNLFLNFIPPLVLYFTKVEKINFAYVPWWPMIGAAILSLMFNFLINLGIVYLGPLVISVGMLCGIPLNYIIDIVFRHVAISWFFIGGTAFILVSFVLIIFPINLLFFPFRLIQRTFCPKAIVCCGSDRKTVVKN